MPKFTPYGRRITSEEMSPPEQSTVQIPVSEALKDVRSIREYRGTKDYDLSSFIREVDLILPLFSDSADQIFQRYILNKIQGDALDVIRALSNQPTWQQVKKELITAFGVRDSYEQIYEKARRFECRNNVILTLILLILTILIPTNATRLEVQQIFSENGYVEVNTNTKDIVTSSDLIIHTIDPTEISYILNNITKNLQPHTNPHYYILINEIEILKSKIKTLIPKSENSRQKRGLINLIGSAHKYLFGTMDDEDRKDIENHLRTVDKNLHNTITNLNHQIKINDYFSNTFKQLKLAVEEDRKNIKSFMDKTEKILMIQDQLLRINILKEAINHIQENIVSAQHGILHPSILTNEEINNYQIDLLKLQYIKICAIEYKTKLLMFIIKIPKEFKQVQLKAIIPVPNTVGKEKDSEILTIFQYKGINYNYQEAKTLNELRKSRHCIFKKTCKLIKNNLTEILYIDEETILIKNANNTYLSQNCDEREIILNKNALIHFNYCTIKLLDRKFSNTKTTYNQRFYYPNNIIENFTDKITINELIFENSKNIKEIENLKYHKNISYFGIVIITIIILSLVICLIIKEICKKNKIARKSQESFSLGKGGVKPEASPQNNSVNKDNELSLDWTK